LTAVVTIYTVPPKRRNTMDGRSFWDSVHADKRLEYLGAVEGETPAEDAVIVRSRPEKRTMPLVFSLAISAIGDHSWDEILSVFLGERRPDVMLHVTRIVGYYSFVRSWNRSKQAELRDRHKGNYVVPEAA
jgi:hypothetical protein